MRTPSPTTTTTTIATARTTPTSNTHRTLDDKTTSALRPSTTTVITATTTTLDTNHDVAHKRKGRRRKPHRKHTNHKTEQTHESNGSHSSEHSSHGRHGQGRGTLASYDDEDYVTTDYTTWMNSDISSDIETVHSVKPTSATLPTWESFYPSSAIPVKGEVDTPNYSSTATSSIDREITSSVSSSLPSLYDIREPTEPLMPLPFPTSAFFATSLHDNTLGDEAISPTMSLEELESSKTTNTSDSKDSKDNEKWSTKRRQHEEGEDENEEEPEQELVAKLAYDEHLENSSSTTLWSSSVSEDETTSEETSDELLDGTTAIPKNNDELPYVTPTKSTEPQTAAPSTNKRTHKVSRHKYAHENLKHLHNAKLHHSDKTSHKLKSSEKTTSHEAIDSTVSTSTTTSTTTTTKYLQLLGETKPTIDYDLLLAADKGINTTQSHNTVIGTETDTGTMDNTLSSTLSTTISAATSHLTSPQPSIATTTTRKALRKSTQRLLATPFHQLTYVRNEAGDIDIDIDNLDNISMYPDLMDNDNINSHHHHHHKDAEHHHRSPGTSRFTKITGYQPSPHTSDTSALPESIRIAKIKIDRELKRMLRLRNIGDYKA